MATPQKILVTGSATSSLSTFFTKLASLQAKHSFHLVLALDLFSNIPDDSLDLANLLAGTIAVPVQVYAAVGLGNLPLKVRDKLDAGEEICHNVTLLGKTSVLTLASGIKLATFGGQYSEEHFTTDADDPHQMPYFTASSLSTFASLLTPPPSRSTLPAPPLPPPDILLTHAFPSSLTQQSKKPFAPADGNTADQLDQVAAQSRAKYHFISGAGGFWEREPFSWPREQGGGVCRSIALGAMGTATKDRWFYAFSLTPHAPPASAAPPNSTPSPYASDASGAPRGTKRPAGSMDTEGLNEYGVPNYIFSGRGDKDGRDRKKGAHGPPPDHYTCNICDQKGHWIQDCPEKATRDAQRGSKPGARPIQPDECWFCLSNPKVTKHLIAAIGSETYLTLPKGQLIPTSKAGTSSVGPVPGGGHVLIIPIAHYPTLASVPAELAVPIVSEMEKYKSALKACYASFGAQMMSFEVGRLSGKGGHAHVQVCPIPNDLAAKAGEVFRAEGAKLNIDFEADGLAALKPGSGADNYFRVDLPDGETLVHVIKPGVPFGLQFGRATVATLLGIPDRTDWKACVKSDAEEKADCGRFKAAFKAFDPSE